MVAGVRTDNGKLNLSLTCPHCSSNCDVAEDVHCPSEDEAQPYKTMFSEGLYFRRMFYQNIARGKT